MVLSLNFLPLLSTPPIVSPLKRILKSEYQEVVFVFFDAILSSFPTSNLLKYFEYILNDGTGQIKIKSVTFWQEAGFRGGCIILGKYGHENNFIF